MLTTNCTKSAQKAGPQILLKYVQVSLHLKILLQGMRIIIWRAVEKQ